MFKTISKAAGIALMTLMIAAGASFAASDDDTRISKSITDEINKLEIKDPTEANYDIEVVSDNGVVYLRGEVKNPEDISTIEGIASSTEGVKKVENELRVKGK